MGWWGLMKTKRTLDETNHILHLYSKHIGETEVPMDLHVWSCLAGIAACVGDRVWVEKFKGKKLTPSLYTFLIAPSGRGKGIACDTILDYVGQLPVVNAFAGATTAERLMEMMSNTRQKKGLHLVKPGETASLDRGKIFLVMEELALCIGAGPQAAAFVKVMTGFYKRDANLPWRKETVAGATAAIEKGQVNWLVGTTKEWMIEAIPPDVIQGGFAGRIACVYIQERQARKRVWEPKAPPDFDEIHDHLAMRFERLTRLSGVFVRSERARQLEQHWYETRPDPSDERLIPTWNRQHDLLLKIAMVLSLCEAEDLKIRRHHMAAAQKMAATSYKAAQQLLVAASSSPETRRLDQVRELVKQAGSLQSTTLMRMASSRGIPRFDLLTCLDTLKAGHEIENVKVGKRLVVVWRKRGLI